MKDAVLKITIVLFLLLCLIPVFSGETKTFLIIDKNNSQIDLSTEQEVLFKKQLKASLIKTNIFLGNDDQIEKPNSTYIYLKIEMSDKLVLSAKKIYNSDSQSSEVRLKSMEYKILKTVDIVDQLTDNILKYISAMRGAEKKL